MTKFQQFIVDGGPPSLIVLVFGCVLITFAALYARRPAPHQLAFIRGLTHAAVWIMVGGFASGVRVTLDAVARLPESEASIAPLLVMKGVSEALAVVVLGTGMLTLGWFLTAIGLRRSIEAP